jgi:medium-chain acyl-[acyl-carrier-protein] hydrolase
MRLFCFPFAGGGASTFRSWGKILPAGIECVAIKLPGREDRIREPAFTRISGLVQALLPELIALLDRPFAFYGHSMGGLIAFELVLELRRRSAPEPSLLLIGGCPAPENKDLNAKFQTLSDAELLEEVRSYRGDLGGALEDLDFRDFLLPLLRADFELYDTYTVPPDASVDCPLVVFGGKDDPKVAPERLAAWRGRTRQMCDLQIVPGGHFFLNSYPEFLLGKITEALYSVVSPTIHGFFR